MDINLIKYIQDVEYGYKPDIVYTGSRIWICRWIEWRSYGS